MNFTHFSLKLPLFLVSALSGVLLVPAADLDSLADNSRKDLDAALAELSALRQQIEAERLPLARKITTLEQEVMERRAELDRARRFQENQLVELNALKSDVKRRGDEVKFLEALLAEYLRAFETRIHISEVQRYHEPVDSARTAQGGHLAAAEQITRQVRLIETALQRLEGAVGGERFEGKALTPAGRLEKGQFALVGPVALFASAESGAAGVVQLQLGSPEPSVVALPEAFNPALKSFALSGEGEIPVDASMGNALKISATRETWLQHVKKGGPVMVPILALGVCSVLIFLTRWLVVSRIRTATPADLQVILGALNGNDRARAEAHAKSIRGPVGEMLHMAIGHFREKKEYVEEVMYEKMIETKPRLEKLLPFLALAAAAAPLLGLLGTVTGMINTFNMITVFGTGDPKTLAGGISEALITTEYGLVVAIPSLLLHAVLSRRVKGVLASMEQTTVSFINGLPESSEDKEFANA